MGRVMVVDDEPDMRLALRLFLERNGHVVDEAGSGEDILGKLNASRPDLVLLDMRMPGIDGLQTLSKIRESNKSLPIIMMTGYGSQQAAKDAYQMGASHYMLKPFKHEDLLEAMTKVGLGTDPARRPPDVKDPASFVPGIVTFVGRVRGLWESFNQVLYMTQEEFLTLEENLPDPYRQELSFLDKAVNYIGLGVELVRFFFRSLLSISWNPQPVIERRRSHQSSVQPEEVHKPARPKMIPGMNFETVQRAPAPGVAPPRPTQALPQPVERPVIVEEKMMSPAPALPKPAVSTPPSAPRGMQESPQDELHRLLIKVQTAWDQNMGALGKDLSNDLHLLDDCSKNVEDLRRFIGPSEEGDGGGSSNSSQVSR